MGDDSLWLTVIPAAWTRKFHWSTVWRMRFAQGAYKRFAVDVGVTGISQVSTTLRLHKSKLSMTHRYLWQSQSISAVRGLEQGNILTVQVNSGSAEVRKRSSLIENRTFDFDLTRWYEVYQRFFDGVESWVFFTELRTWEGRRGSMDNFTEGSPIFRFLFKSQITLKEPKPTARLAIQVEASYPRMYISYQPTIWHVCRQRTHFAAWPQGGIGQVPSREPSRFIVRGIRSNLSTPDRIQIRRTENSIQFNANVKMYRKLQGTFIYFRYPKIGPRNNAMPEPESEYSPLLLVGRKLGHMHMCDDGL